MECPVCGAVLSLSERQGVEIDYCPECRGVWLDRGELDKIIARVESDAGPDRGVRSRDERSYEDSEHDHRDHEGRGQSRRKRSFLSDLLGD